MEEEKKVAKGKRVKDCRDKGMYITDEVIYVT